MFVLGKHLKPSLILTLPANIGTKWKGLPRKNTQAYFAANVNDDRPNKLAFAAA
jgi:hypothetical protein